MHAYLLIICLILVNSIAPLWSQVVTGDISGRVLDSDGHALENVNIIVESPNLQGVRGTASDKEGFFKIMALPAGTYVGSIRHIAHQEVLIQGILVRLGRTTSVGEICLQEKTLETEKIIVISERPLIDPTSAEIGAFLANAQYETLPLERDYRSIASLIPNANESYYGDEVNIGGATGFENKYFLDGVETTDPYRGITGTVLPFNIVKEIEVKIGGYEAEYRSALGGIINAITYSGGNEFSGQIFGFYVNNRFSGAERQGALEPNTGNYSQYDFGFTFSGPLVVDKLWFFTAYNPTFNKEYVEIPGKGFFQDKSIKHIFTGKLTWQATKNTNLLFTILGDPSERNAVGVTFGSTGIPSSFENPDPYLTDITTGGINILLKGTHIFSNNILLDMSLSRITRKLKYEATTERGKNESLFVDEQTGIWSGGYPTPTDDLSIQTTADITGTFVLGRHTLKTGFEYRDNQLDMSEVFRAISRYDDSTYTDNLFSLNGTVRNSIPSIFLQDSWQLSNRLLVNAGLRWDGQFLIGSNDEVAQEIINQYQPRIGIIFQPGELGSQKLFGSIGRFYQDLALTVSTYFHLEGAIIRFIRYDHDPRLDVAGGDTLHSISSKIYPEVKDLEGQYYDELNLGYERHLGNKFVFGIRGIYRSLEQIIETSFVEELGEYRYGNPGKGYLSTFPEVKREYFALEITLGRSGGEKFNFLSSYVLSRNYGNYPGLFQDYTNPFPNSTIVFTFLETMKNGTGLLPNDRTHVIKFSGSYRFDFGLTIGTFLKWQTGTPLNEYGGSHIGPPYYIFLKKRGTAGRTPSIYDLNFRFAYDLSRVIKSSWKSRLILDIFHLGTQRNPVDFSQVHYYNLDENGNQTNPNPIYGRAVNYQPPMSLRLGMEIGF